MDNPRLQAALQYVSEGWKIFPIWWVRDDNTCACGIAGCDRIGKHPISDGPLGFTRGLHSATDDPSLLQRTWSKYPQANVGGATGSVSGWDVLDIDVRGGGIEAWQQLREQYGEVPNETPVARTPSGGRHYYFRHADGVTNRRGALPVGIDVRGDGGYVLLAPSAALIDVKHPEQGVSNYSWITEPGERPPGWLRWLLNMLEEQPLREELTRRSTAGPLPNRIGDGMRNATITSLAGSLRRRGLGLTEIFAGAWQTNLERCEPPLSEAEVRRICEHMLQYEPPEDLTFTFSDIGNARRFVEQHGSDIRYCHPMGKWLYWNGKRWCWDNSGQHMRLVRQTLHLLMAETEAIEDEEARDNLRKYVLRCSSLSKMRAIVELATSEEGVPIDPDELDQRVWELNASNGTINLKTGELQPFEQDAFHTRMLDTAYNPNANCPLWESFLLRAFSGSQEMVAYMQRLVGYCLTGTVGENAMPVNFGTGANGKSTFAAVLQAILGSYAGAMEPGLLLARKSGESHPTGLADLFGKRLVFAVESQSDNALNESLVKQLTGGDRIKARRMREDFWEFDPTFKLWMFTNHKPKIRDNGPAIWRRIHLIPWEVTIPKEEQDKDLQTKLTREAEGILKWAVDGCRDWQEQGLNPPKLVLDATQEYQINEDWLGAWIQSSCEEGLQYTETTSDLYEHYLWFLKQSGFTAMPHMPAFSKQLTERGYSKRTVNGEVVRTGLRLRQQQPDSLASD